VIRTAVALITLLLSGCSFYRQKIEKSTIAVGDMARVVASQQEEIDRLELELKECSDDTEMPASDPPVDGESSGVE